MSRFKGPRAAVFERAVVCGLKGVTSDDAGVYTCHGCGSQWPRRERYAFWPVSVIWSWPKSSWLSMHGVQIGADAIEQRVFARMVRVGPLVFRFGWREEYR